MSDRKVLKVRKYKAGYEIRDELVSGSEFGCEDFAMKAAYTTSGDYIGDTKWAYRLCKKMGIAPEKIGDNSNICSIGFCKEDQKWYGWSHRAMFGFGVGATIKKGSCGYTPSNVLEIYSTLSDDEKERVVYVDADKISIEYTSYSAVAPVNTDDPGCDEPKCSDPKTEQYDINVGRGTWTAETIDDAKLMAIDFAREVS